LGASSLVNTAAFSGTKNPWNLTRNSGGSSGGSSAAVAVRIVPMAYASGGDSIRLPASCCGIFGFKPSRELNKFEDLSRAWGGAVVSHVSTLSVRDSAAYLDLVTGHTGHGYSISNPAQHTYLNAATNPPKRLKIALIPRVPTSTTVHGECIKAARLAAKHCEALGHDVEKSGWNFEGMELMRAFLTIVFRYTCGDVVDMARLLKAEERNLAIELNTRFMAMIGSGIRDEQVQQALTVWKKVSDRLSDFYQRYDVILTPTVATPPLRDVSTLFRTQS
jgi:amidase